MSARTALGRRRFPTVSLRVLAFLAVLSAHAALLVLLWVLRGGSLEAQRDASTTVLLLLPWAEPARASAPSAANHCKETRAICTALSDLKRRSRLQRVQPAPQSGSAPVAIDWAREAALAASRRIDAAEEAARKAQAFSARRGSSLASGKRAAPRFGWSYAHTHRFETVPGAILFNLNDRCVILMTFMLMPICRIGKIEERGDLFQHMNEPLPLGALDDVLP
ncbi:MAG TPA: hypothetical protein VII70_03825 [Steroidobacteraceae bacterium]